MALADPPYVMKLLELAELIDWLASWSEPDHAPTPRELAEVLWLAKRIPGGKQPKTTRSRTIETKQKDEPSHEGGSSGPGNESATGGEQQPTIEKPTLPPQLAPPPFFPEPPQDQGPEPLAHLLPLRALPTRRELNAAVASLPVRLQAPRWLPADLSLLRALRPLMQRSHVATRQCLDEEATAERSADHRLLQPVFRPTPEPRFTLTLLVDRGLSMEVWQPMAEEFRQVLERSRAFRDVQVVSLIPPNPGESAVGFSRPGSSRIRWVIPDKLRSTMPFSMEGEGRDVLLLLSDTAGPHWWNGSMFEALAGWSRRLPVALLHMLPLWMAQRTALRAMNRATIRNGEAAAESARYRATDIHAWDEAPARGGGIPVLRLETGDLANWAAMAMGDAREATAGVVLPQTAEDLKQRLDMTRPKQPSQGTQQDSSGEELWDRFRSAASPEAQRLMVVLAAAPILTLPVMRLLKESTFPKGDSPLPLVEVLLGGLLRPAGSLGDEDADATIPSRAKPDGFFDFVQYAIQPAVMELLRRDLSTADTVSAVLGVSDLLERRWNTLGTGYSFQAVLSDPEIKLPSDLKGVVNFATATAELIERLPGEAYQRFAAQLRQRAGAPVQPSWPASMRFEEVYFETAQLLRIPEPEAGRFAWAQFEEIELSSIAFTTASIELDATSSSERSATPESEADADQLPPEAAALIQLYEGCRLQAYPDPGTGAEPITIGWGSTFYEDGSPIRLGDVITQEQADALYHFNFRERFWNDLKATIPFWSEMNDKQKAALCSFAYNNGVHFHGDGNHDTLDRHLRDRRWKAVPGSLMMYRNPGTNVEVGLGRRRRAEGLVWEGKESAAACTQAEREIATPADCEAWEQRLKQAPPTPASRPAIDSVESKMGESRSVLVVSSWTVTLLKDSTWGYHEPLDPGPPTTSVPPPALTMLRIPAGSFLMGSPTEEPERSYDEGPQHAVTLAEFFLARTPITQAQWRAVANWQPGDGEPSWERQLKPDPLGAEVDSRFRGDERPVVNVSWHDAMEFCRRLRRRTGKSYTLPSEAQWEYACRAGSSTTPFHFGATISPQLANYDASRSYAGGPTGEYRNQTTDVATFPANAWGLQDMHGNVSEWCLDHWHDSYVEGEGKAPTDGSAWMKPTAEEEEFRLLRGGSWVDRPGRCRSALRGSWLHGVADDSFGFRVCCLPQDLLLDP